MTVTMKTRTTEKEMKQIYGKNLLKVGYCNLQSLLRFEEPVFYTAGSYGWNSDFYTFYIDSEPVCISTGYRPIGSKVAYSLLDKYERKAMRLETKEEVTELLYEFIRKALEGDNY